MECENALRAAQKQVFIVHKLVELCLSQQLVGGACSALCSLRRAPLRTALHPLPRLVDLHLLVPGALPIDFEPAAKRSGDVGTSEWQLPTRFGAIQPGHSSEQIPAAHSHSILVVFVVARPFQLLDHTTNGALHIRRTMATNTWNNSMSCCRRVE
jgi:hypothetical protein